MVGLFQQDVQAWTSSPRPKSLRHRTRRDTYYSRKRSEHAWRRSLWAEQLDSDSRDHRHRGRAWCSVKSPFQTSSGQTHHIRFLVLAVYDLPMPSKPPYVSIKWDAFLLPLLQKKLFRTSLQQLHKGPGWWLLTVVPCLDIQSHSREYSSHQYH